MTNSALGYCTRPDRAQITCLYDMDIPRPDNFNETYLYEGMDNLANTGGALANDL
jgi:hypothetical protein